MVKVINAFCNFKTYKGQNGFDKEYIERKLVPIIKKVGPGESDFIIKTKVIDKKVPIKEIINKDADSVGVVNVIRQLTREYGPEYVNDNFINNIPKINEGVADYTGMPSTLMEAENHRLELENYYNSLPIELTRDPLDPTGKKKINMYDFFKNLKPDTFKSFYDKKRQNILRNDKAYQGYLKQKEIDNIIKNTKMEEIKK